MKASKAPQSHGRLDAFARGATWGTHVAGLPRADIVKHVQKPDGGAVPVNAVDCVIATSRPARRGLLYSAFCLIRLARSSRAFRRVLLDCPLGAIGRVRRLAQSICAEPPRSTRGQRGRLSRRVGLQRRRRPAWRTSGRLELCAGCPQAPGALPDLIF